MKRMIIAGFGPVGRAVADSLAGRGIDITLVDTNPETVRSQSRLGRSIIHGDATDPDILVAAGVGSASAIVITVPDPDTALRACRAARALSPGIFIATRTGHLRQAMHAHQVGVDSITIEEIATAEAMARVVADRLGARGHRLCEGAD